MLSSVRDIILKAVGAYATVPRAQWVLDWPGQIVICGDSIFWTMDVTEAIQNGTMKVYKWFFLTTPLLYFTKQFVTKCYLPIPILWTELS